MKIQAVLLIISTGYMLSNNVLAQEFTDSPHLKVVMEIIRETDLYSKNFQKGNIVEIQGFVEENHGLTKVGLVQVDLFLEWPDSKITTLDGTITGNDGNFSIVIQLDDEFIPGRYIVTAEPKGIGYQGQLENDKQKLEFFIIENSSVFTSPLKQYKSGVSFNEIKCNKGLQLTQKYDDSPACVTPSTYFELIERRWVSNIILAVQSRDIYSEDVTSSYMEKIIPTIDDFRMFISSSPDIDTIYYRFGEPSADIGSGIHIYVYELNDSTQIWIGYSHSIMYVRYMDAQGNILESLFELNEKLETSTSQNCDPSYPDVCIPPFPPDLDCKDIPHRNFKAIPPDRHKFDGGGDGIGCESPINSTTPSEMQSTPSQDCLGTAQCFIGKVTKVVDGDTIDVDGKSIRFSLSSTPEMNEFGGPEAREYVNKTCPVGSTALVDEDDGQKSDTYSRIIGVIYCNGYNLNEAVLEQDHAYLAGGYCSRSEFSQEDWAIKYGC